MNAGHWSVTFQRLHPIYKKDVPLEYKIAESLLIFLPKGHHSGQEDMAQSAWMR